MPGTLGFWTTVSVTISSSSKRRRTAGRGARPAPGFAATPRVQARAEDRRRTPKAVGRLPRRGAGADVSELLRAQSRLSRGAAPVRPQRSPGGGAAKSGDIAFTCGMNMLHSCESQGWLRFCRSFAGEPHTPRIFATEVAFTARTLRGLAAALLGLRVPILAILDGVSCHRNLDRRLGKLPRDSFFEWHEHPATLRGIPSLVADSSLMHLRRRTPLPSIANRRAHRRISPG